MMQVLGYSAESLTGRYLIRKICSVPSTPKIIYSVGRWIGQVGRDLDYTVVIIISFKIILRKFSKI